MGSVGSARPLAASSLPAQRREDKPARLKERGQGILPFLLPPSAAQCGDPRDRREANPIGERTKSAAEPHTLHLPFLQISISCRMQKISNNNGKNSNKNNNNNRLLPMPDLIAEENIEKIASIFSNQ